MNRLCVVIVFAALCTSASAEKLHPAIEPHPEWVNTLKPAGTPASALTLTTDGQTDYRIVVPAKPTTQEQKASVDLQYWLNVMTGATIEVALEDDAFTPTGKEISLGHTQLLTDATIPQKGANLSGEGYAIGVQGERLFVFGGNRRGPIYGVYALLEEDLGCRWYVRDTATIPRRPTLTFAPVPRTYTPALDRRDPYYSDARNSTWSLRNKTSSHATSIPQSWGGYPRFPGHFVHTYNLLMPPTTYFVEHPEYYSENDGVRTDRQLCPTNPDVQRIMTEKVLAQLNRCPDCRYVDVSPNDWKDYCECAQCKPLDDAEGSQAASLLMLVNAVADEVAKVRPEVTITTLAYLGTYMPPKTIRPRDNVQMILCTDSHAWDFTLLSVDETTSFITALKAWEKTSANVAVWDYAIDFYRYMRPLPNMRTVQRNMRLFVDHGVRGVFEQGCHSGNYGVDRAQLRSWVWAKQLWDVSRDCDPLIHDFYYGYFGKAAEPLYEYNQMLHATWERAHAEWVRRYPKPFMPTVEQYREVFFPEAVEFSRAFVAEAMTLFDKAIQLAEYDQELIRRIECAKLPILYLVAEQGPGEDREAYLMRLNEFERIARHENAQFTRDAYAGKDLDRRLRLWRGEALIDPKLVKSMPLSNAWQFKPDPDNTGVNDRLFAADLDDSGWAIVRSDLGHVGWESQGFEEQTTGYGWYRQTFTLPTDLDQLNNMRLFFGGIDEQAVVYINGTMVLSHTYKTLRISKDFLWRTPFHFDPKPWLKPGDNQLTVRVHNSLHVGGIYQPVYLMWGEPVLMDLPSVREFLNRRHLTKGP